MFVVEKILADTNGEWGFSHPLDTFEDGTHYRITLDGNVLTFRERDKDAEDGLWETQFARVVSQGADDIVGTWVLEESDEKGSAFVFLPTGDYMHVEVGPADDAGQTGIEHGAYQWTKADGTFATMEVFTDTNGEWGFSDDAPALASVEDGVLTLTFSEDVAQLERLH